MLQMLMNSPAALLAVVVDTLFAEADSLGSIALSAWNDDWLGLLAQVGQLPAKHSFFDDVKGFSV